MFYYKNNREGNKMSIDNLIKGVKLATYMKQNGSVFRICSKKDDTSCTTYFVDYKIY